MCQQKSIGIKEKAYIAIFLKLFEIINWHHLLNVFPVHLSVLFVESTAASLLNKTHDLITTFFQLFATHHENSFSDSYIPWKKSFESLRGQYCSTSSLGTSGELQQLPRCYSWRVQCLKRGVSEVVTVSWRSPTLAVGNTRTRHFVIFFQGLSNLPLGYWEATHLSLT